MCTGGAGEAGGTLEGAESRSRTLISPNAETPISSGAALRARVDAHAAIPAMAASSASPGSNGVDETAAINRARNDASAMPSPTLRQRRARDDGCNAVQGTSKWLVAWNSRIQTEGRATRRAGQDAKHSSTRGYCEHLQRRHARRWRGRRARHLAVTGHYIRLNTSVPLVPPNPNEFFSAMSMRMSRAVLAQ